MDAPKACTECARLRETVRSLSGMLDQIQARYAALLWERNHLLQVLQEIREMAARGG